MKQEKKATNAARKKAAIIKDFTARFKKGEAIDRIYAKLEEKYFIAKGTIYRIVIEKRLSELEAQNNNGAP